MASIEEQEVTLTYDYAAKVLRLYISKPGAMQSILKRLNDAEGVVVEGRSLTVPLKYVRHPKMIFKPNLGSDSEEDVEIEAAIGEE